MTTPTRAALLMALGLSIGVIGVAEARPTRPQVKFHPDWEKHPATRYGAMAPDACLAELGRRNIVFTAEPRAPGVMAPVRLPADVGGVVYRTEVPAHLRATNPNDVFDCRLVLALSDFSKVLRSHDVDEVLMFSAWRPPGRGFGEGHEGRRHPGGLAMDARRFGKKLAPGRTERVWLDVQRDFHGAIGAEVCGAGARAPSPATSEARELRSIACEAADQHFFNSILTPNYNRAHQNHLHLEVTPGVEWSLVR